MSELSSRLAKLERILELPDPRPEISAYKDMPCAIFRYDPHEEWELRGEVSRLRTRLEQSAGKRITTISLADCLHDAAEKEGLGPAELAEIEQASGLEMAIDTVHKVLSEYQPLDELVLARIPEHVEPARDIVFLVRAGALYPFYRTSSLLDQLMGEIEVPGVLFYPGHLDGPTGLCFMGILDPENNYRPKIY